ncbi:MAG: MBL fold metallo-hydrolase [Candidatus Helarchaeota archaeon]
MKIDFGNGVSKVRIKVLTTNTTDMTLVTDPKFAGKVIQPMREVASATAEHGLALDIEVDGFNILYDFGGLATTILNNLNIFNIDPKKYRKIVLSHSHFDHFGSMFKVMPNLESGTEIYLSKRVYDQKLGFMSKTGEIIDIENLKSNYRQYKKEGKLMLLPTLSKKLIEKLSQENQLKIIETDSPVELVPGVWTSGEIEIFDKSELTRNLFIKIDKSTFEEDTFKDEVAIYINVKDKGLIVLTGCGHRGIINTIKYGKKISNIDKIYAIIGGFHLNWSSDEKIDQVIDYFKELEPEIICGMHCTGFRFNSKLSNEIPERMTLGVVGTEFHL